MDTFIAILILQAVVVGSFTAFIAKEKKRDVFTWFVLGFFFSLIAMIALIGVPLKHSSEIITKRDTNSQNKLWRCLGCGENNIQEDDKCNFCGKPRHPQTK